MRARVLLLAAAAVLCAVVIVVFVMRGTPEPEATAAPTPTQTPTPTPTPTPTFPAAVPFDLAVEETILRNMDNSWMFPLDPPDRDDAGAEDAAGQALETLAAYLNAQFADEATRFSVDPLESLLTPEALDALDDEGLQALGAIDFDGDYTETGEASATPHVLIVGDAIHGVTVEFKAAFSMIGPGGDASVTQSGSLLFLRTEDGWRVAGLEVTLDAPDGQRTGSGGEATPSAPTDAETEGSA